MKLAFYSSGICIGVALIATAPIIGDLRPLVGGIALLVINIYSLVKLLRKRAIKQSDFEQTLEAIKQNEHIKL